MSKILYVMLLVLVNVTAAADVVVVPSELNAAIRKVEERQDRAGQLPSVSAKIIFKDDQIVFSQPLGQESYVSFAEHSPTIDKHFQLKSGREGYAFEVAMQNDGRVYQHVVKQIHGADALFFFNDTEIFIYTQTAKEGGSLELKEWIYALKPNAARGSQWTWVFKSEKWQWPLTVEMEKSGVATVSRHIPFAGIPIDGKARSQYMLDMMVKFKRGEPIKKYFPFSEEVVTMPAMQCSTKEGVSRAVDVNVLNSSVVNEGRSKPKLGFDFDRWDEHWRTTYKITVSAHANEYPLLLE